MCNTREMEKKTQNAMVTLDGYLYFDVPNFQAANLTLRHTWNWNNPSKRGYDNTHIQSNGFNKELRLTWKEKNKNQKLVKFEK